MRQLIQRDFRFYAAHRAEGLGKGNKCANLHGHTYLVKVTIEVGGSDPKTGVQYLFEELDAELEPIVKQLDHTLLLHTGDELYAALVEFNKTAEVPTSIFAFPYPTTVENISEWMAEQIEKHVSFSGQVRQLEIKETVSSNVITIL